MTIDTKDMLNSIIESLSRIDYVKPSDIPNIELYMDQVTTFMDAQLKATKRYNDDKILTKTMINNYAKNNLLPPPVRKKYTKEHILVLIFIYYFKNLLSIKDIETLLKPITEKYFHTNESFDLTSIYEEVFALEKDRIDVLQDDIQKMYANASETFQNAKKNERDDLQLFSFICTLSFDVYVKKQLLETLIDELPKSDDKKGKK